MRSMLEEKTAFSERLNLALESSLPNVPPKGQGRQYFVAKIFGVSQPAARKWLEGEGFPKLEQCIYIAKKLNLGIEWLVTGRGGMRMTTPGVKVADQLEQAISLCMQMPHDLQEQWLDYGKYLLGQKEQKSGQKEEKPQGRRPATISK